jgi:hypothetical protein
MRMIRRRDFIVGLGAAAWPMAVRAQQSQRMRRVGVLMASDDRLAWRRAERRPYRRVGSIHTQRSYRWRADTTYQRSMFTPL